MIHCRGRQVFVIWQRPASCCCYCTSVALDPWLLGPGLLLLLDDDGGVSHTSPTLLLPSVARLPHYNEVYHTTRAHPDRSQKNRVKILLFWGKNISLLIRKQAKSRFFGQRKDGKYHFFGNKKLRSLF